MFDAAARHLNFRLAAEELHLTQGAVAQQVRRLEADLGCALFHRRARGLAFTEIGRRYHPAVRRALAIIDQATRALHPESMRVTVSVPPSLASKWLVPRLGAFARAHPDIEVQTVATEDLASFRTDGVDVAIRQGRAPFAAGLRAKRLAPLELCAVCEREMAAAIGPITGLEDFTGQPLVQDGHGLWDALFDEAGLGAPRRVTRFNQTALAMDAAANGQGIALAPRLLLADDLARGRLVELWSDARPDRGGFHIVWPADAPPFPARDALVDWLRSQAASRRD